MGERATERQAMNKPSFLAHLFCKRFAAYAVLLSLLFAGAHLLGFREHVGILSGTSSLTAQDQYFGAMYLLLYAGFVVFVPIFLLATALGEILVRWLKL